MTSTRQIQYAKLIQKEISSIFTKHGRNYFGNNMVTVTTVSMSPDLGVAKIYLSPFKVKDHEAFINTMNSHKSEIRNLLGRSIRNQVRIIPELIFYVDDSLDYIDKMEKLFNKIDIPPAEEDSENLD